MHKRGLCRRAVFVCLSLRHFRVFCRNEKMFRFFSLSGSHIVMCFSVPNVIEIFRNSYIGLFTKYIRLSYGNIPTGPPNWSSNAGGIGKNRDPRPSRFMCVVNAATARCYQHGVAGPWQIGDTHRC